MKRSLFAVAAVLALAASQPAVACRIYSPIDLQDVQYADVVLVGRISNYRIIRDEAFRRERLSRPNLSPEDRALYGGPTSLLTDYARFEVEVVEVLHGKAPKRLSVTWDNSTFGEPDQMPAGPFLMALRHPSSAGPPLRGPSATFFPNAEPELPRLLQAPCSSPFLFESASVEANTVRWLLDARKP